jgi:signal transduction histidine kinase
MLQNRLHGDSLAEYDELLERSQDRLSGMRRLIQDLLDMTMVESKCKQRDLQPLDLRNVLRDAMETLSTAAAEQQVEIKLHGDAPIVMAADAIELSMIAQNLISNAVKYNRRGGQVHITADRNADTVTISVADTGCGIPNDQLDRLCDEFVRVKSEATRHIPGSGLGLSIVDKIARLYGGEVAIDSEEGVGSTFTVVLHDDCDVSPQATAAIIDSDRDITTGALPVT